MVRLASHRGRVSLGRAHVPSLRVNGRSGTASKLLVRRGALRADTVSDHLIDRGVASVGPGARAGLTVPHQRLDRPPCSRAGPVHPSVPIPPLKRKVLADDGWRRRCCVSVSRRSPPAPARSHPPNSLAHHRILESVGAYDTLFLLGNIAWILTIVLLPFAAQVAGSSSGQSIDWALPLLLVTAPIESWFRRTQRSLSGADAAIIFNVPSPGRQE